MTVDEREREKLRDILQGMARDIDGVDMEVAEFLWGVSVMVEGGDPTGMCAPVVPATGGRGFITHGVGSQRWSVFPLTFCAALPMCAATMPTVAGPT